MPIKDIKVETITASDTPKTIQIDKSSFNVTGLDNKENFNLSPDEVQIEVQKPELIVEPIIIGEVKLPEIPEVKIIEPVKDETKISFSTDLPQLEVKSKSDQVK